MRVLELDRVDEVDAEIAVHRLVAQDVLVLLRRAGHLVLPAHREDLHEADVEEEAFHDAGEDDQALQQLLVGLHRAGLERRDRSASLMNGIRNSSLSRIDFTS